MSEMLGTRGLRGEGTTQARGDPLAKKSLGTHGSGRGVRRKMSSKCKGLHIALRKR